MASIASIPPQLLRTIVVGSGALVSGLGSYLLLIVVARALSLAEYSDFAAFWALSITVGLGLFFPLEQETARESAATRPRTGRGLLRTVTLCAAALAVLGCAAALLLLLPAGVAFIGAPDLVLALICSFAGYSLQFTLRGFLSGARRSTSYTLVIVTEGVLRIALPALLLLLGSTSAFAYAMTVAVAAALAVLPALLRPDRSWLHRPAVPVRAYLGRLARLVGAAFSIQLILNSGTILGRLDGAQDSALAGQILACLSIARIPVFVYQVGQMLYLPRLSGAWSRGDLAEVRKTLLIALGFACAVALAVVGGMSWLGAPVIGWLFDPSLVLSEGGIVVVSTGAAVFLVALVVSDGVLAIGRHGVVLRSWIVAAVGGALLAVVITDPLLRATVPMIAASAIAVIQLGAVLLTSYARRGRSWEARG